MKSKIKTLSLFSGAGGLDLGFHTAGYEIVACVEIEETYCETLRQNIGSNKPLGKVKDVLCKGVEDFDAKRFKDAGIECVIGGPPCQTFSAAGRRSGGVIGTSDRRGRLFERYCEILADIGPRVFVFENVYGLPGANGGEPWREILKAFSELGYTLRAEVVDSADYGVPQHRERLFMVGFKMGEFEFPMPTHGPDSKSGCTLVSVRDAIADIQDPDEPFHDGLGGLYGHLLPLVPEGLNYSFFTAEMGHPEPQFAWRSKFHDLLYKVAPDEPCRTIKAQPGKFTGPFHWKNRHFTVGELKRLQSFPDDFEFKGSQGKILEQIGNSVPPRLAYVLASSVREQTLRPARTPEFEVRSPGFTSTFRQRQRERSKKFKEIAARAIAEQYPNKKALPDNYEPLHDKYFVHAEGHFNRTERDTPPDSTLPEQQVFEVIVNDERSHLNLSVARIDRPVQKLKKGTVEITGLKKYLGRIESVHVETHLNGLQDIFHVWVAIEKALVFRSRFFSLIDIYGHYANRGDTVSIWANYDLNTSSPENALLDFVSRSNNCGEFMHSSFLLRQLQVSKEDMKIAVAKLRNERFDIRTRETHPIIRKDVVISTYPFPLLSAKALVISRAEIVQSNGASTSPYEQSAAAS